MFFLMRDWEREMVDPCLLAREIDVALDNEAASFIILFSLELRKRGHGSTLNTVMMTFGFLTSLKTCLCNSCNP